MGTEKHSAASKRRWAKIPKAKRSLMMAELARKKHEKLTPEQRTANALKMVKGRKATKRNGKASKKSA